MDVLKRVEMNLNFLIKRAAAILTRPREEWEIIKEERTTIEELFARYAVILAAVPALAGFLGYYLFGKPTPEGETVPVSLGENVRWATLSYALSLGSVYLLAYIIDVLAPYFGSKKDMTTSTKVVVYSHTASWTAGILLVVPQLSLLAIFASLYSLFLLYTGMRSLKEVPAERMAGYFGAAIVASIIISFAILLVAELFFATA